MYLIHLFKGVVCLILLFIRYLVNYLFPQITFYHKKITKFDILLYFKEYCVSINTIRSCFIIIEKQKTVLKVIIIKDFL